MKNEEKKVPLYGKNTIPQASMSMPSSVQGSYGYPGSTASASSFKGGITTGDKTKQSTISA